jgi:rubrerythrin
MNNSPHPSVDALLSTAMNKEESARDSYKKLAEECPVDFVRELLEKLRDEEEKHIHMIRDMQARLRVGRKPV